MPTEVSTNIHGRLDLRREIIQRGTTHNFKASCRLRQVHTNGLCLVEEQVNASDLLIGQVFLSLQEGLDLQAEFRHDVLIELPIDSEIT